MTTEFLASNGIPFEEISHGRRKSGTAQEVAQVTNLPLAYIGQTALVEAGNRTIGVIHSGDTRLDPVALQGALAAGDVRVVPPETAERITGQPRNAISPLTLWPKFEWLWDLRCLRLPALCVPGRDDEHTIRIDTRYLRRLALPRAAVAVPLAAGASAYDVLLARGFIDRVTDEEKARAYMRDPAIAAYVGFDPTADSLHVGSLLPIMALANVQRSGMRAIAVVGGATGLIGDPSGKTEMRQMLTRELIRGNMAGIARQLSAFLAIDDIRGFLIDNADWFAEVPCLDFLREIGPHFPIRMMLNKECFRSRMDREGEGLTYLELTYMLMQAYDFVHLAETRNCRVQMGGSDQWGNICAGVELGRKVHGSRMFDRPVRRSGDLVGVTFALLKKSSGGKFGKTESGNVWLDDARTSAYDFFQFWRNTDDLDVERFLGVFTLLPLEAIHGLCPGPADASINMGKEVLALAATTLAHGKAKALAAVKNSHDLFGGYEDAFRQAAVRLKLAEPADWDEMNKGTANSGVKSIALASAEIEGGRLTLIDALIRLGLATSKGEARRLIEQGGVYLNDQPTARDPKTVLPDIPSGSTLTLRAGKKKYGLIRIA